MTDENTPPPAVNDTTAATEPAESHAAPPEDLVTPVDTAAETPIPDAVAESKPAAEAVPAVVAAEPEPVAEPEPEAVAEPEPEPLADVDAEVEQESAPTAVAPVEAAEAPPAKPKRTRKPKVAAVAQEVAAEEPAESSKTADDAESPAEGEPGAEGAEGAPAESGSENRKKWYVVKIQSGREDSIKAAIERKVKIEGLEAQFGQIAIPVEEIILKKSVKVKDKKTGDKVTQEKKVVKHNKKYPGYLFAEVEFNDKMLYLFRETSGVGDFVGAGLHREPTALTDLEVTQMLTGVVDKDARRKGSSKQVVKLDFEKGDKVKIRDGAFANMEGEVKLITESKEVGDTPKVKVEVTIFGRPVEVDLDYWHVDKV